MKRISVESPTVTDASATRKTGTSLKDWYKAIDKFGGAEKGRREVTGFLYGKDGIDDWWMTTIAVEYESARGIVEKDGKPKGYSPCATKTINAPLPKVYEAWSSVKSIEKWFTKKARWDFKAGGKYESAEGDRGEFLKTRDNKDFKFTWDNPELAPGTIVEVLFQSKSPDKTTVMVNHTRIQKRDEADILRASWGHALDQLKTLLESK